MENERDVQERCGQRASPDLSGPLTVLSVDALDELMRTVRAGLRSDKASTANEYNVWEWAVTLATLTHDVAMSVHVLATHNNVRAGIILNRSLSEYRLRLQYYVQTPDAATADMAGFEAELRSVIAARPIAEFEAMLDADMMQNVRDMLTEPQMKGPRRQIRQMFEAVYGDKADLLYDLHYALGSAFAHGKVLATGDVLRRADPNDNTVFSFHPQSNVFPLNNVLGEAVGHVIAMLGIAAAVFSEPTRHAELEARFAAILEDIEPAPK
jgi:hypothetical protein